mgnify:FL=1
MNTNDRGIKSGFEEVLLSVKDEKPWIDLLVTHAGWKIIHADNLSKEMTSILNLVADKNHRECVISPPDTIRGRLRLLISDPPNKRTIRGNKTSWDTGGIFDLNVRVKDINVSHALFKEFGWQEISEPIHWNFGSSEVKEVLMKNDDGIILALIQRIAPEPPSWHLDPVSRVFNSSLIVRNMSENIDFFSKLGFHVLSRHEGILPDSAGRVLGLTHSEALSTSVDISIMHPSNEMNGSIELVQVAKPGSHEVQTIGDQKRGIQALRFPIENMNHFMQIIGAQSLSVTSRSQSNWQPIGSVDSVTITSPDAAQIEFFCLQN